MKEYQAPTMEILVLTEDDVIMASGILPQTLRYFGVGDVGNWDDSWN